MVSSLLSGDVDEGGHKDGDNELDREVDLFRRSFPVPLSRERSKSEMINPGLEQPHGGVSGY
jgi:hypothetical protein